CIVLPRIFFFRMDDLVLLFSFCVQHHDPEAEGGDHRTQEVHRQAQEGEGRVRQLHAAGWRKTFFFLFSTISYIGTINISPVWIFVPKRSFIPHSSDL
ncbi:MAG: hypothetical protein ACK559_21245, partial [bacterium]